MIKKNEVKTEHTTEGSHPGVAEPVEDDLDTIEDIRKKLLFYKIERLTTTDSGISTWVLLSGQTKTSTTAKPPKLSNKNENIKNTTIISTTNMGSKPLFKKRPSIMNIKLNSTTLKSTSTTITPTTAITEKHTKFTQLKTAALPSTENQKNSTFVGLSNLKRQTSNTLSSNSTPIVKINGFNKNVSDSVAVTTILTPELKDGDLELPHGTANSKKSRRPTNKKKKDKNRRKRPSADSKNDLENKTKVANKVSQKEKPISTQIYNYLAREVMPTVGVGLVGLVVTAGLASYFLYPFSGLRRSYEIDRKDKDLYYYDNGKITSDYDGGIAEEEAIGKVIAGMPFSSNNYGNSYSQKSLTNNRYRQADSLNYQKPTASVESLQLQSVNDYNKNENYLYGVQYLNDMKKDTPSTYKKNIISQSVEASYTTNDQQFVVGNAPQEIVEEVTPAAVPEHGPRNLKIRRRRNLENEIISNDINVDETVEKMNKLEVKGSIEKKNVTNVNASEFNNQTKHRYSFVDFFKDLFTSKLKIGLELLQNQTLAFSRYLSSVNQSLYKLRNNNKDN
ncbi:hypothetical protein MML48_4g00018370 [Holotrichia oblita]|uniref:Uncharacterized protein n=1 Tax=Holotrichia oblita TaxID=644536 RepID=A0ACB9T8J7_HOLOL|nr:hypothetical protein MML48_4g00018370 [Holotrichia oblita]